jgi:hypothetical protein
MNRDDDNYVGYGHPPKKNRFQKGESGNLKGRPRKAKPLPSSPTGLRSSSVILDTAYKPVTLRDGDKVTEVSMIEAVMLGQLKAAAQGNRLSAKWLFGLVQDAEKHAQEVELAHTAEVLNYMRLYEQLEEQCQKEGRPMPEIALDPRGFYVNEEKGGFHMMRSVRGRS